MYHLAKAGILHLDLNLSNILVLARESTSLELQPVIIDWGLSAHVTKQDGGQKPRVIQASGPFEDVWHRMLDTFDGTL